MKHRVYLILVALADADLHGLGIAREVQQLSDGRIRLWPASLYGTLDELSDAGWIEELDDPRDRPADESEKKRFYRLTRAGHRALAAETDRLAALVAPAAGARFDRVFAYVARPEHHAAIPPPDAVVLSAYENAVEEAFATLGERELERYRASTDRGNAERIDAYLLNGEIPAGNPRRW